MNLENIHEHFKVCLDPNATPGSKPDGGVSNAEGNVAGREAAAAKAQEANKKMRLVGTSVKGNRAKK